MAAANFKGLNIKSYEDNDSITNKAPFFDGENFEFWKEKLESFFLGYDADLWDLVIDGYVHPTDNKGKNIERRMMNEEQKIEFKNHHIARTFMLDAISLKVYENITNRDTTYDIFESLKLKHKENTQVKEIDREEDDYAQISCLADTKSSESESEEQSANTAYMEDTEDDADSFRSVKDESSECESKEVFSLFTKTELADSLSKILEKYNQLKVKYKKLQSTLLSEK